MLRCRRRYFFADHLLLRPKSSTPVHLLAIVSVVRCSTFRLHRRCHALYAPYGYHPKIVVSDSRHRESSESTLVDNHDYSVIIRLSCEWDVFLEYFYLYYKTHLIYIRSSGSICIIEFNNRNNRNIIYHFI
jgi:hypothetical protein